MPFILQHGDTGEVAAAVLRNVYDLDYYGAEWWSSEEEALHAAADRPGWAPVRVSDSRLKVLNVKFNNDASRRLFMAADGTLRLETSSAE